MNRFDRNYDFYLDDMLKSMEKILEFTKDLTIEQLEHNTLIFDAVIRNFEILGEASKNIPNYIKEKYPDIPWQKMYGLRNILTHEYFGIDVEMIWHIIKNELEKNKTDLSILIINEIDKKK
jgi:uncharacterized protein with HEPN domain